MSIINNTNISDPLENLLQNAYSDYSIPEPNLNSWSIIKKNVVKHNFLKFNLLHFNIYYAVIVSMVVVGTGLYFFLSKMENPVSEKVIMQDLIDGNEESLDFNQSGNQKTEEGGKEQTMPSVEVEQMHSGPKVLPQEKATENSTVNTEKTAPSKPEEVAVPIIETDSSTFEIKDKKVIVEEQVKADDQQEPLETEQQEIVVLSDTVARSSSKDSTIDKSVILNKGTVIETDTIVKVVKKRRKRRK